MHSAHCLCTMLMNNEHICAAYICNMHAKPMIIAFAYAMHYALKVFLCTARYDNTDWVQGVPLDKNISWRLLHILPALECVRVLKCQCLKCFSKVTDGHQSEAYMSQVTFETWYESWILNFASMFEISG